MISYLKGKILEIYSDTIVLLVNNIGYNIFFGKDLSNNYQIGDEKSFYTYLNVREDAIELYGFEEKKEKDIFLKLKLVSGIGAKSAINMIAHVDVEDIVQAIIDQDESFLIKLPGCGKKTAQRIILELKDKFQMLPKKNNLSIKTEQNSNFNIVNEALLELGYSQAEIQSIQNDLIMYDEYNSEKLLRKALSLLM